MEEKVKEGNDASPEPGVSGASLRLSPVSGSGSIMKYASLCVITRIEIGYVLAT